MTLPRLAEAIGLSAADVESELIDLGVAGLVRHEPGDFGGWGLTERGRSADTARIAAELEAVGARDAVARAYDAFLMLNPELLDLCTAWQMRSLGGVMTMNVHDDPTYDARVLDRVAAFHRRATPVCTDLAVALPRFERYAVRLEDALTQALSGATEYIADNTSSYHAVWFQLHEDLLVTLGMPRH